jgi:hypothetical protein
MTRHWSHACHIVKHLIDLYHLIERKGEGYIKKFSSPISR